MAAEPKVWLITGCSKGFGRIWAEAALARGDKVTATARDASTLEPLLAEYGEDAVLTLALDVDDKAASMPPSPPRSRSSAGSTSPSTTPATDTSGWSRR